MSERLPEGAMDIEDEEVFFEHSGSSPEDVEFDTIVGCLEEIVLDDTFQNGLVTFYQENCGLFEETKENKLEYTDVFTKFTKKVESLLESRLSRKIDGFTMNRFEELIATRQDELSGDVFDLLILLGDFEEFKENMIAQKKQLLQEQGGSSASSSAASGSQKRSEGKTAESSSSSSGSASSGGVDLHVSGKHV